MAIGIDAVLKEIDGGLYDIEIDEFGDIKTADAFDTAIVISLLTDARAAASEVSVADLRRGWIGNEHTPGFEIGGKLWIYEQSRLTKSVMIAIQGEARRSLEWMVDQDLLVAIRGIGLGFTSDATQGMVLELRLERSNNQVEHRYFNLWNQTGVSS
jgi:phage gp46-like protein